MVAVSSLEVVAAKAFGVPTRREIVRAEEAATEVTDFQDPPIMQAR